MAQAHDAVRDVARNRQAFHLYEILDRIEAGIVLTGFEVKSVRQAKVNLRDAFARIEGGEAWLHGCHITPYERHTHEGLTPVDPLRKRKLLLHRSELARLRGKVEEKGLTLVALRMYFKGNRVKVELGLGRGKHTYDKRDTLRRKDQERETARALRERG
jgi:SsrA-binding protein